MLHNFLITIIFKTGERMQGIRSHSSPHPHEVRPVVRNIIERTISLVNIDQIDVVPTARMPANGEPVKRLEETLF